MRGARLVCLTAVSLAMPGCSDREPRRPIAHKPAPPQDEAVPSPTGGAPTTGAVPESPAARPESPAAADAAVVLAVDQSRSMQGFAATGSMTAVITDAERAIRAVAHRTATYYSLGATADKVAEDQLLGRAKYTKDAADLQAVLDGPELRAADVLFAFTDGQPTAARPGGARLGPCTPDGTQVIADLDRWFAGRVAAGDAVWIVLEKVPFQGQYFLNCSGADQDPAIAKHLGARLQCDTRECSYLIRTPQDRALVGVVIARPAFADTAAKLVEDYLRDRSAATAVRLHRSAHDHHTVDRVTASRNGAREYAADVRVSDNDPQTWQIRASCPRDNPDVTVRVCVQLRAPAAPPGLALSQVTAPEITGAQPLGRGRAIDDWLELPPEQSLDLAILSKLQKSRNCSMLWRRYVERTEASGRASEPSDCVGGDGFEAHELVTSCGCTSHRTGPIEVRFEQRYRSAEDDVLRELSDRELSADRSWFEQPDRVNGLAELVHRLAAAHSTATSAAPHPVLRLTIDVKRP